MSETNTVHFEWQAHEFKPYEKSIVWYIGLCVIVSLLALYQFFVADYFGAITMVILGALIIFFAKRKPEIVQLSLDDEGVGIGELRFPYRHFKHFWIVTTKDHRTLNLEASTYLSQTVILELEDQDPEKIRKFLVKHVPESERVIPSFSQRIAHRLKF